MKLPDFLTQDQYGYVKLAGHRIGLHHVVRLYRDGADPAMIHDEFPTLSLALIHRVIAFYLDNQADVDAYVAREEAEFERQVAAAKPGPDTAELRKRLESRRLAEGA